MPFFIVCLSRSSRKIDIIFSKQQSNQARAEKTRSVLQKYMDAVLSDERLNQSEVVYSFLSPSPNYLKKSNKPKKNLRDQKFHLSNFFKSTDLDHESSTRVLKDSKLSKKSLSILS